MIATESVAAVLTDLKSRIGGIATALVSRNGLVLFADLLKGARGPEAGRGRCPAE